MLRTNFYVTALLYILLQSDCLIFVAQNCINAYMRKITPRQAYDSVGFVQLHASRLLTHCHKTGGMML